MDCGGVGSPRYFFLQASCLEYALKKHTTFNQIAVVVYTFAPFTSSEKPFYEKTFPCHCRVLRRSVFPGVEGLDLINLCYVHRTESDPNIVFDKNAIFSAFSSDCCFFL